LIDIARTVGDPNNFCSTCKGGGLEQRGFRATIKAQVEAKADNVSNIPAIITVLEAYSSNVVDPETLETSLIAKSPCRHFFSMNEFGMSAAAEAMPTVSPTAQLTSRPTRKSTVVPTLSPTARRPSSLTMELYPSNFPSTFPSNVPSDLPSINPSNAPSASPSSSPFDGSDPRPMTESAWSSSSSFVSDTESLQETMDTRSDAVLGTASILIVTFTSILVTFVIYT
jgi:hypothetical protein